MLWLRPGSRGDPRANTPQGTTSVYLPFIIPNFVRSSCPPSPLPFFPPTRYLSYLRQLSPPSFWSILVFPFVLYLFQWSQSGYTAINAIRKFALPPFSSLASASSCGPRSQGGEVDECGECPQPATRYIIDGGQGTEWAPGRKGTK